MKTLPQRVSLVAQTASILRDAIAEGQWPRWLPGEIELCRRLTVSRVTLRHALAELEREKIISSGQGRRREVLAAGKPARNAANKSVVLLSPTPLHRLPSSTVFWMDELREHLDHAGRPLLFHERPTAFRARPVHALEELAARLNPSGWVLYRSTPEMQRWFSERSLPAVITGSRHEGVQLSSVDIDHAAACRHAAGRFSGAGRSRVAIIRPASTLAGDLGSVAAFREKLADTTDATHDGTIRGITTVLARLFARPERPDALFVFHSDHLLTVLGWLHQRGIQIPRDVSLICRDHEPFLESVLPNPARYTVNATAFARKISRLVLTMLDAPSTRPMQHWMMPTFVRGETV